MCIHTHAHTLTHIDIHRSIREIRSGWKRSSDHVAIWTKLASSVMVPFEQTWKDMQIAKANR